MGRDGIEQVVRVLDEQSPLRTLTDRTEQAQLTAQLGTVVQRHDAAQ